MGKKNKRSSVLSTLPDHRRDQGATKDAYDISSNMIMTQDVQQRRYLGGSSGAQHGRHKGRQRERLPQSDFQISNANSRSIKRSRRLKHQAEKDTMLSVQGPGYTPIPPAPFQTSPAFNDPNYNRNLNYAQGQYVPVNDCAPYQNRNMTNFGWGSNYAVPTQMNQTPIRPAFQQGQLFQIPFAQQVMMTQVNGTPVRKFPAFNNAIGMQQKRQISGMANAPPQPYGQMPVFIPEIDIDTPDAATEADEDYNSVGQPKSKINPPVAPVPWPSYLDQANKLPQDLLFNQPLLVILDLNGTLLYRKRKKLPPQFVRRPALNYFLERVTSRHMVMVWSSSRPETVNAICDMIFTEAQKKRLVARWGRDKLGLSNSQYYSKVQVYKELEKVWANKKIQKSYPKKSDKQEAALLHEMAVEMDMTGVLNTRWDQSNTVLIDDSVLKAAGNPYNILEVPEFTHASNDTDDSKVLKTVLHKLGALAKSNNVSQRLRSWGEDGIKISRDEILNSDSSSSCGEISEISQSESGSENRISDDILPTIKEDDTKDHRHTTKGVKWETEKIIPQHLPADCDISDSKKMKHNKKRKRKGKIPGREKPSA